MNPVERMMEAWMVSSILITSTSFNEDTVSDQSNYFFRYFDCPPQFGIFVPLAKVSLSPSARKPRLSRSGSKESLTSVGTLGSIASTATSRLRMSAQVPLTASY